MSDDAPSRCTGTGEPTCPCDYCRAVYQEWAEQARGFQRWFEALDAEHLRSYFGLEREMQ